PSSWRARIGRSRCSAGRPFKSSCSRIPAIARGRLDTPRTSRRGPLLRPAATSGSLRPGPSPTRLRSAMKITGTRTELVELPADEPLAGAAENPNGKRPIVTVAVETDQGIEGLGVAYFGRALSRTLRPAIDELGALCVG